jgi:hypothetical protein
VHPHPSHRLIPAGKLPLLQLEAEGAEALKARGADCLTVFLAPPSQDVHEARVRRWLAESDEEIAARQVGASPFCRAALPSCLRAGLHNSLWGQDVSSCDRLGMTRKGWTAST